ncbi:MAG: hypothetical protein WDN45_00010 [Caulobacteraceae bacterium]
MLGTALAFTGLAASAAPSRDALARDVERAEGIRAVKALDYAYAQYAQYGLWNEMGAPVRQGRRDGLGRRARLRRQGASPPT